MSRRADTELVKFPGSAAFSLDAAELDPPAFIRLAKSCGLLDDLRAATDYRSQTPRRRMPGEWGLAFLAFAASPTPDLQPWWRDSARELWWECGFQRRPPYDTVYMRFRELEERGGIDAFFEASAQLVRLAVAATGGLVGRDVHVDGAEAETNARLLHDCQPGDNCPDRRNQQRRRRRPKPDRAAGRLTTDEAKTRRQEAAAKPLPDDEDEQSKLFVGAAVDYELDRRDRLKRVRIGNHWWRITDPTAGCRTYEGKNGGVKSWVGFNHMKATDHAVGEAMVVEVASASEQEYNVHPQLYEKLKYILGGPPRSVTADKGLAVRPVCELHTSDGVFSVMPWRGSRTEPRPLDRDRYDRHGIPRCENCGARCRFVSFQRTPKPRLFFECADKPFAACSGRQSVMCSEDWRMLLPLWRDDPLYRALRASGMEFERVHRTHRQRHACGGNTFATRPKRKGRDWQQLLANASVVATWLKLCWRNGWLPGSTNRVTANPFSTDGADRLAAFMERRLAQGLERAYGARAQALGTGPWRVRQYDGALPAPSELPRRQHRGGPARRELTPLPPDAELIVGRPPATSYAYRECMDGDISRDELRAERVRRRRAQAQATRLEVERSHPTPAAPAATPRSGRPSRRRRARGPGPP